MTSETQEPGLHTAPVEAPGAPTAMGRRTKIFNATIVGHDGRGHALLDKGVLTYAGDTILHVGREDPAPADGDEVIDGTGMLVIPGQISAHAHIGVHEATRLLLDGGRRQYMRSGFPNFVPTRGPGGQSFFAAAKREDSLRFGLLQLLRNGVTTVVNFDHAPDRMLVDMAGEVGIRLYFAPACSAGRYHYDHRGRMERVWDEKRGFAGLERAIRFIQDVDGAYDGRIRGLVVVDEFYNATLPLLKVAKEAAVALGVPLTMHFCEQLFEFHETVRNTGRTPVQLLADHDILGPETILAHCLYVTGHSMAAYPYGDDLELLAASRTNVAHSPIVFARRGVALESFQRYRDRGINIALGTDTFPMDMFAEMRTASEMCKLVERNHEAAPAEAVFAASNLGGGMALGRDDLGLLAPGAKADFVMIDTRNFWLAPAADPIRNLVACGHPSMIDTVVVAGRTVVRHGRLVDAREEDVLAGGAASCEAVWGTYSEWHWAGRSAAEELPPSLPAWTGP